MNYYQLDVSMMPFKPTFVDLSGGYMAMTQHLMLVFVHTSNGILKVVCFNDAFQLIAPGFIREVNGQNATLNVCVCARLLGCYQFYVSMIPFKLLLVD